MSMQRQKEGQVSAGQALPLRLGKLDGTIVTGIRSKTTPAVLTVNDVATVN
jgi:hypothetical protein